MQGMRDVLELLSEQHRRIDRLLERARDRQGPEAERAGRIDELADYVTAHLAVERELLYPRIAARLSPVVHDELIAEHAEIRRVLGALVWLCCDDDRIGPLLGRLEVLLAGHCGWQDEALVELLVQYLPEEARCDLGETVRDGFETIHGGDPGAYAA